MSNSFLQGLLTGQQFANRLFEPYQRKKQQDFLNKRFQEEKRMHNASILNMLKNYGLAQQREKISNALKNAQLSNLNMRTQYPGLNINDPNVQLATLHQLILDRNKRQNPNEMMSIEENIGAEPQTTNMNPLQQANIGLPESKNENINQQFQNMRDNSQIPSQMPSQMLSQNMRDNSQMPSQMLSQNMRDNSQIPSQMLPQNMRDNSQIPSQMPSQNMLGSIESSMANIQRMQRAKEWNSKDKELKTYEMQKAKMMGYTPTEAYNKFLQGSTLETLADEKGLKLKDLPEPKNISPEVKKAAQLQTLSFKTLQPIQNAVSKGLAPYVGSTVLGIPMGFIRDRESNKNLEQQAQYLAALSLAPEDILKRIKSTGANFSVRMLDEMVQSSYGRLMPLIARYKVSPRVFKRAEYIINETLNKSQKEAQKYARQY